MTAGLRMRIHRLLRVSPDLRQPEGAEIFKKLVAVSDVVTENFQPGTLESWGVGYDTLKQINPRLIMLRVSGFGQTGPWSPLPAIGGTIEPVSGMSAWQASQTSPASVNISWFLPTSWPQLAHACITPL